MKDFEKWNLHDAIINNFNIDWKKKTCTLSLNIFFNINEDAVLCKIVWKKITEVQIPLKNPWGDSIYVNSQRKKSEKEYLIEMQSGDEIIISAEEVELLNLYDN
jgi:hypothetical protein